MCGWAAAALAGARKDGWRLCPRNCPKYRCAGSREGSKMRREATSTDRPRRGEGSPGNLPGCNVWLDLFRPALLIGFLGGLAVLHLLACARLSLIECDRQRLKRVAADADARGAELRRELAQRRNARLIREHAEERGLQKPARVVQITLDEVPTALWAEMPEEGRREPGAAVRLGQVPGEAAAAPGAAGPPPLALQ